MSTKYYWTFLVLAISLILWACTKEPTTISTATLYNETSHIVGLQPYSAGVLQGDKVITLQPQQSQEIAHGWSRGINGAGSGFSSDNLIDVDSIVVTYDYQYRTTHYLATPSLPASNYHLYASTKKPLNINSYSTTVQEDYQFAK